MHGRRGFLALFAVLLFAGSGRAGLYYSGESMAELPSQWRGFLLDQRTLRNLAVKPRAGMPVSPARQKYEDAAACLEKASGKRKLTAEEQADLGAIYVRLGEPARAVELLRAAQREYPNQFRIVANLGTAWQVQGDLGQAAASLQQAVHLAPGKFQKPEEYQLKLVRFRERQALTAAKGQGGQDLDDLFGIQYVGEDGQYHPGQLAARERKKLPSDAAAVVQQLALWLPADGPLLWQLAELANAHGDVKTAAAIMDGCVTELGLHSAELRRHRRLTRAAADELANSGTSGDVLKAAHEGHAGALRTRSRRPLLTRLDETALPPISPDGINALPWALLGETALDRKYQPTFPAYLKDLDGKRISLSGFMQPLDENGAEMASFMLIEYPVGCWYCEMPEMTGIVLVKLSAGKTATFTRGLVKVTGKLILNATDPENFLYTVTDAKVAEAD